jgi:enamine deaminase RidA (YjgF/YER057c/UK114 family)
VPASTELVRAGNWVFGTGLRETNLHKLFQRMSEGLNELGSSMSLVARLDQYYPDVRCVPPYQAARKEAFKLRQVAPSTSVMVSNLQDRQAQVDVQVIAATSASGYALEEIETGLNRPETSAYAPCLRVGDLIFVAGQLAREPSGALAVHGTAPETDYIVRRRLIPALEAAGSGLDQLLKAQVYLSRPEDLSAFWQNWREIFGNHIPPTTVVPLRHPAFLSSDATIEINVIAAHRSAGDRVRRIRGDVEARVLDGLLFMGGLTGSNMGEVLERAAKILEGAGSDLPNVVRALFFNTDAERLPDPGFPFSAFQVDASVDAAVDGGLVADIWGYAPDT